MYPAGFALCRVRVHTTGTVLRLLAYDKVDCRGHLKLTVESQSRRYIMCDQPYSLPDRGVITCFMSCTADIPVRDDDLGGTEPHLFQLRTSSRLRPVFSRCECL
jgi:hypothetical protein